MNRAVKAICDLMKSEPERWHFGRLGIDTWSHPCGVRVIADDAGGVAIENLKLSSFDSIALSIATHELRNRFEAERRKRTQTNEEKETERLLGLIRTREQRLDYQTRRARLTDPQDAVRWEGDVIFDSLPPL